MNVVNGIDTVARDPNSVVTVGSFDGVHLAHREIIREVVHRARIREGRSVVVTFDPHPSEVVAARGSPASLLTTLEERIELIRALSVELVVVIPFTKEFSVLSPTAFYTGYVIRHIGLAEVVIGYDHMFGHNRVAGVHELIALGEEHDFSVFAVHPYAVNGEVVSSTLIRAIIGEGDMERAASLLGYPYMLRGTVVRGDGVGKKLGFPTANISVSSPRKLVPGNGVYLVAADLDGARLFGMMNIGTRPTVSNTGKRSLEVHLFGLDRDIYEMGITVTFLRRLRHEIRFVNPEELMKQLDDDRRVSLKYISELKEKS